MSIPATLTGRIANEVQLSFSKDGNPIARFTIVTSGRRKNKDNDQWEDVDVSWWRCTAFGQLAENMAEYMGKGDAVIATGTASQDDWEKDGVTRTSLKCIVNNLGKDLRWTKRGDKPKAPAQSSSSSYEDEPPF